MPKSGSKLSNHTQRGADRKSGRAVFDEAGRGIWEWQTATGVFEKHISDEQLTNLEAPQLSLVEDVSSSSGNSYFEWQGKSKPSNSAPLSEEQATSSGVFRRLIGRLVRKA